jgi:hypothetical protein
MGAHVLEDDLGVVVLVAKQRERTEYLDPRSIAWYQYHREAYHRKTLDCRRALSWPGAVLCVLACGSCV